jgi:hypothetical protein
MKKQLELTKAELEKIQTAADENKDQATIAKAELAELKKQLESSEGIIESVKNMYRRKCVF